MVVCLLMKKKCYKCKEVKPLEGFNKDKRDKYGKQTKCRECERQYREANKEAIVEYKKQHYQANKEAIVEKTSQYKKERRRTDPIYRLMRNISRAIRGALVERGYTKKSRTHEILGCSFDEYHQHIEAQFTEGMSWDSMSEIEIDHRLPVSAATTEAELLALNHHRNLQPMWKADNRAKGSSYCPKELAAYFKKHIT